MTNHDKSGLVQRALLSIYSLVQSSGIMSSPLARAAYTTAYFAYKRHVEDPFARLAARNPHLFAGGDVLDVGANIGYTATVFARAIDRGFRVHAFEPEARNFEMLQHVLGARGLAGRVVAVRAAVGCEEGAVEILVKREQPSDHRVLTEQMRHRVARDAPRETVPLLSLDRYAVEAGIERVAFIKVDVQGYELAVCEGMARLLERNPKASVAIEYAPAQMHELGFEPAKLRSFFEDRGYRWHLLTRAGELRSWLAHDAMDASGGYCDLVLSRAPLA